MFDHNGAEIIAGSCLLLVILIGAVVGALHLMAWWYTQPARQGESIKGFNVELSDGERD